MRILKLKLTLFAFFTASIFFGGQFLTVQSADSEIIPSFSKQSIKLKQKEIAEVNLHLKSIVNDKISGATVFISYPANILEYIESSAGKPNAECRNSNYKINQILDTNNSRGIIEITKVLIADETQLPSGEFCLETLTFKAKPSFWFIIPWFKKTGVVKFSNTEKWQVVGPNFSHTVVTGSQNADLSVVVAK